jgi:hypothetical protein
VFECLVCQHLTVSPDSYWPPRPPASGPRTRLRAGPFGASDRSQDTTSRRD